MSSTPAPTCQLCFQAPSAWRCKECDIYLCEQLHCDQQMHRVDSMQRHHRTRCDGADTATAAPADTTTATATVAPVPATTAAAVPAPAAAAAPTVHCEMCDDAVASVRCAECRMPLCAECNADLHAPASKAGHTRTPLGAAVAPSTAVASSAAAPTAAASLALPASTAAVSTPVASVPASPLPPPDNCIVCDEVVATLTCYECALDLCEPCSAALHKPAKMVAHAITPLGGKPQTKAVAAPVVVAAKSAPVVAPLQPVVATAAPPSAVAVPADVSDECEVCEDAASALYCPECAYALCSDCDRDLHKPLKMQSHKRGRIGDKPAEIAPGGAAVPIPPTASVAVAPAAELCGVCDEEPAEVTCTECKMALCIKGGCDGDMHAPAKMQGHHRQKIGGAAAAPTPAATTLAPPNALAAISRSASTQPSRAHSPARPAAPAAPVAAPPAAAPSAASMCDMCDEFPAELNCESCGMALCIKGGCDTDAHRPAKSAGHVRTKIGAPVSSASQAAVAALPVVAAAPVPSAAASLCEMCESEPGVVSCDECAMDSICRECDSSLHKPAKLAGHKRAPLGSKPSLDVPPVAAAKTIVPPRPITPVPAPVVAAALVPAPPVAAAAASASGDLCEVCDEHVAEVSCADCSMMLCIKGGCNADIHKPAKMQGHARVKIGEAPARAAAPSPPPAAAAAAATARPTSAQPVAPVPVPAVAAKSAAPAAAAAADPVNCEMCDSNVAEVHCSECDMDLCLKGCDSDLHRSGKSASHKRTKLKEDAPPAAVAAAVAAPPVAAPATAVASSPLPSAAVADAPAIKVECDICGNDSAVVRCEACKLNLCFVDGCDKEIHKAAAKANHVRTAIAGTGAAVAAAAPAPAAVAAAPVAAPVATAAPVVEAPAVAPQAQAKDPAPVVAAKDPVKPVAGAPSAVPAAATVVEQPKKKPSPLASASASPSMPARKPSIPRQPSKPERKLSNPDRNPAPGSPRSPGPSKRASSKDATAAAAAVPLSPNSSTLVSSPLPTDPQELAVLVEQLRTRLVQVETEAVSAAPVADKPARRKKEKGTKPAAAVAPVPWHQQDQEHVLAASSARAARIKARTLAAQGGATFDAVFDAPPVLSPSQQRLAHLESLISHQLSGLREDLQGVRTTAAELEEAEAEVALTARRPASAIEANEAEQEREERRRRRAEKKERKESRRRRRDREQALRELEDESSQQQSQHKGMEEEKDHSFLDERQRRKQEDELLERELGLDRAASDDRDPPPPRRRSSPSPPARNGLAHFEDADEPSLVAELLGDLGVDGGPSASTRRHVGKRAARAEEAARSMEQQQQRSKKSSSSGAGRAARIRERLLAASKLSDDATQATLQSMGDGLDWSSSSRHRSSRDFSVASSADAHPFSSLLDPSDHALSAGEMVARYRREARLELERRRERDMEAVWAEAHAVATAAATASVQGQPIVPLHEFALSHLPRPPSAVPLRVQSLFAPQPSLLDGGEGSSGGSSPRAASPPVGLRASPAIYSFLPRSSGGDQFSASMPVAAYAAAAAAHASFPPPPPPTSFQEELYGSSQPLQHQQQQSQQHRGRPLSASMHAAHRSHSRGSGAAASSSSLFRPSAPSSRPRSAVPSSAAHNNGVRSHRSVVSITAAPVASQAHHRLASPKHPPAYHPAPSGPPPLPAPPAHSFYRRPAVAPAASPSDRLVEGVVSAPDPSVWRQTNLRTIYGLRGVQKVLEVAKQTMHDKHNPYLR